MKTIVVQNHITDDYAVGEHRTSYSGLGGKGKRVYSTSRSGESGCGTFAKNELKVLVEMNSDLVTWRHILLLLRYGCGLPERKGMSAVQYGNAVERSFLRYILAAEVNVSGETAGDGSRTDTKMFRGRFLDLPIKYIGIV